MIKEKLEQEAKDYLRVQTQLNGGGLFSYNVRNLLVGFAESKEKRIEELEQENAILKGRTEGFEKQILGLLYKYESVYKRFPDLKDAMNEAERVLKENTELKSELTKKADTNHSLVEQMAKLEEKNAELKHNKETVVHLAECLEEKMKERIEELETRCTELFLQNNEFAERFEKSKEIIKGLLSCCRNYPQENAEKMEQAEQFLKEIGK